MNYDLVVIGGGAAGMMAAGQAAKLGARTLLLEKNRQLGVKLLITGKGRCNITSAEEDMKTLIQVYGSKGKFLYAAFKAFSNFSVIDFFEKNRLPVKIERGQRVFPVSDQARDVVNCLSDFVSQAGVHVRLNASVMRILADEVGIQSVILHSGEEIRAKKFILATGGKSYPSTGSSGDAYSWMQKLGHKIIEPKPALTPIVVEEKWVEELAGLSLKNVEISLWNDKKIASYFGEALFTHNGLSGPVVLNLSNQVDLKEKQVLKIDFKPALDHQKLDLRIRKDFELQSSKLFKNSLNALLPKKIIPVFITLSGIPEDKKVAEISKQERKTLLRLFKEMTFCVKDLYGFEKAIVTAGGVDLKEINPKTMQSKRFENLYFAGELLDLDGPTGGYNLQVAWSTGYLAAQSAVQSLEHFG